MAYLHRNGPLECPRCRNHGDNNICEALSRNGTTLFICVCGLSFLAVKDGETQAGFPTINEFDEPHYAPVYTGELEPETIAEDITEKTPYDKWEDAERMHREREVTNPLMGYPLMEYCN